MVALCAIWGLQQVTVKATSSDVAPILQISIRSGAAALLVVALMLARGERIALGGEDLRPGLAVGGLFALEFLLVGEGLRRTTASHAVMFLYTAPIFAALGLHLRLPSERLRAVQWAGIALALVGIIVTFAGRGDAKAGAAAPLGDLLTLGGGVAWGATTVAVRGSRLSEAPATRTLLYQ
ncbi:EamA family transporter, partial [bacterium]